MTAWGAAYPIQRAHSRVVGFATPRPEEMTHQRERGGSCTHGIGPTVISYFVEAAAKPPDRFTLVIAQSCTLPLNGYRFRSASPLTPVQNQPFTLLPLMDRAGFEPANNGSLSPSRIPNASPVQNEGLSPSRRLLSWVAYPACLLGGNISPAFRVPVSKLSHPTLANTGTGIR